MGISSPGIGSNIDVNGIVAKLMAVESQPIAIIDKKAASYQAKISAFGSLSSAVGAFQGSLSSLTSVATFQAVSATSANTDILVGSATSKAVAGVYSVNVTQLAQAQTLTSNGLASISTAVGLGVSTTLSFQLGAVSAGSFGLAGTALAGAVLTGGISNGALSINGTAIATDSTTRSAKALAEAINAKSATTGVSATAATTNTSATLFGSAGASSFGDIDTSGGGTYALSVGGITLASQGTGVASGAGVSAASIDTVLGGANPTTSALAAAGITFSGTAAAGDLVFHAADGSNINLSEAASGSVLGGIGTDTLSANTGVNTTASAAISLSSATASPITVGGNAPALAGLAAGSGGSYLGASFNQDANQISGTVVIDSTNNSLAGIRDAINKANLGVTATIISDGSATPNHLVLSSTKTGASSTIKLSLAATGGGAPDSALSDLLAYDPAGVQNLKQNTAAQSTLLNVNGIPVSSETSSVSGAIQGVSLTIGTTGKTTLTVAKDSTGVKAGVNAFVKAYNDLNSQIAKLTAYDTSAAASAKLGDASSGGPLLGDATVRSLQTQLRKQLSQSITGLDGDLTTLSQVGIAFQKDGSLSVDSGKLDTAVKNHFDDIAGLFAAVGKASDSLVSFNTSTSSTKPGDYALNVTALASQGSLTGDLAVPLLTTIAAGTKWNVTLNQTDPVTANRTASVSLAAGSYSPGQLATLIQSAINGAGSFGANELAVNASIDGAGKLVVVSAKYGSISKLAISSDSGTQVSDIFGSASALDGTDIAGTLGGQPATGSGQLLTGAAGSDAAGLKVEVTGGATGARGTVGFSQGYAYQLNNLAANFLGAKGLINGRTDGLNATIKDLAQQKDDFNARLVDIEKRYRAQYTALDTSISSLNSTSSFLTQQFAALAKQTS
ncbi:MAG: flagellar filament capping protein FliD [Pseudomonadota bacterium]